MAGEAQGQGRGAPGLVGSGEEWLGAERRKGSVVPRGLV